MRAKILGVGKHEATALEKVFTTPGVPQELQDAVNNRSVGSHARGEGEQVWVVVPRMLWDQQGATGATRTAWRLSMNSIETVKFYGDEIQAVRVGERALVVIRRMCEALAIAYQSQWAKLKKQPWAVVTMIVTTGPDGKRYKVFCLSLDRLPMWLATIEPSRANESSRPKLIAYQRECADVLHHHFFGKPCATPVMDERATADGLVHIGQAITSMAAILQRQDEERRVDRAERREERAHVLLLARAVDDIKQRMTIVETSGHSGMISPQTHARIQALVRKIAAKEVLIKRWPNARAASRDIYRELGERTGWGGKQQKWCDLPAQWESLDGRVNTSLV